MQIETVVVFFILICVTSLIADRKKRLWRSREPRGGGAQPGTRLLCPVGLGLSRPIRLKSLWEY